MTTLSALAPAKVNLYLHVGPPQQDGYHPLCSLVAFADVGDVVTVAPADRLSLEVTGPFGAALAGEGDNLVLRALRALGDAAGIGEPPLAVTLDKRLPIAAGLGGGSSDAAAALRLTDRALSLGMDEEGLVEVSRVIGADGPMCLRGRSAWAEGVGDVLTDAPELPGLPALLVNPGVPSPTGAVYRAYDAQRVGQADRPLDPASWSLPDVVAWLSLQRNDLEAPAIGLQPEIARSLAALRDSEGLMLARMSGSGATVFGVFGTLGEARDAGARLKTQYPGWWISSGNLGGINGNA
ncbi:MAG: 4-(cytidine 5'-diphospho)-2-C-methyl-D-erythritol kinase [Phenylobacterium zucineum]|nr:MAG: 4-(cytidine 5'-diphospho)-2-C-methyl-D-erythritol kinase [Phenylobacterium zucineum]